MCTTSPEATEHPQRRVFSDVVRNLLTGTPRTVTGPSWPPTSDTSHRTRETDPQVMSRGPLRRDYPGEDPNRDSRFVTHTRCRTDGFLGGWWILLDFALPWA